MIYKVGEHFDKTSFSSFILFYVIIQVWDNGEFISQDETTIIPESKSECEVVIKRISQKDVQVTSSVCGFVGKWDGNNKFQVAMDPKYAKYSTGLCGACDKGANPYQLADGTDVSAEPKRKRDLKIGNSYEIPDVEEDDGGTKYVLSVYCTKVDSKVKKKMQNLLLLVLYFYSLTILTI